MEEDIRNLQEIINLAEEDIKSNNENVTAILDLEDLKSLENVLSRLKQVEKENKTLKNFTTDLFNEDVTETFIHKDEIKEKFDNKINDYRQQRMQLADGHTPSETIERLLSLS